MNTQEIRKYVYDNAQYGEHIKPEEPYFVGWEGSFVWGNSIPHLITKLEYLNKKGE